jgi:hypothetical protein
VAGYLMDVTPMDLEERMALIAGRDDVMPARSRYANAATLLAAAIDREANTTCRDGGTP